MSWTSPTTGKVWTFGLNATPTDQANLVNQMASFCLQLKNFLVAGGWSVVQSCNTTSFATNGMDYWSTTADITFAATTSNHSWVILKSPVGLVPGLDGSYTGDQSCLWFSIDCNYVNTAAQAKFYVHRANPTIGTAATNLCPTSTYQYGWAAQQFLRTTFANTAIFHFRRTSQGHFDAHVSYSGAGYMPFTLRPFLPTYEITQNTATPAKDYPFPGAGWCKWLDSSYGGMSNLFLPTANSADTSSTWGPWVSLLQGWCCDGSVGAYRLNTHNLVASAYNALSGSGFLILYVIPYAPGSLMPSAGGAWSSTNTAIVDSDVSLWCVTTGKVEYVGKIADLYCTGNTQPQGTVNSGIVTHFLNGSYMDVGDAAPYL
jgi:hypothetical protein